MNAPPRYSRKQVVGGHSTNCATPPLPTSVRKEPRPSCSKPKADTKTHAHLPFIPNRVTKQ